MNSPSADNSSVWRNGFFFALILLFVIGLLLIWIGAREFQVGTFGGILLVGIGISMGPSALVAILFRVFLFKEIKYQLTHPVVSDIRGILSSSLDETLKSVAEGYRREILLLGNLKESGLVWVFRKRKDAVSAFRQAIAAEENEIAVIGCSLKGLLIKDEYSGIANELRTKMAAGVRVKFMLTHPAFADFRASQENREFKAMGKEIVASLRILSEWGVPADHVRLFKGTPTCFAMRTATSMLLNPYPYCSVGYDSPCFIIATSEDRPSYVYDAFNTAHFGAWDKDLCEQVPNYEEILQLLQSSMDDYAENARQILNTIGR